MIYMLSLTVYYTKKICVILNISSSIVITLQTNIQLTVHVDARAVCRLNAFTGQIVPDHTFLAIAAEAIFSAIVAWHLLNQHSACRCARARSVHFVCLLWSFFNMGNYNLKVIKTHKRNLVCIFKNSNNVFYHAV